MSVIRGLKGGENNRQSYFAPENATVGWVGGHLRLKGWRGDLDWGGAISSPILPQSRLVGVDDQVHHRCRHSMLQGDGGRNELGAGEGLGWNSFITYFATGCYERRDDSHNELGGERGLGCEAISSPISLQATLIGVGSHCELGGGGAWHGLVSSPILPQDAME